jgi:GH15 family glucan-1,4-alpha-glucosidase
MMMRIHSQTAHDQKTAFSDARRHLDHLCGYKGSRPVRIGNAARDQCQLDVYGEVIDAAAQYAFHGGKLDREMQKVLVGLGDHVVTHWDLPDEGIWEPRTGPENHTHSRLLCWTALDRLITLHLQGKIQRAPVGEYTKHAEAIRQQIKTRGWNEKLESYVSVLDGDKLDSSLLLMTWYGFGKADSPRMQGTYRAIRQRLGTPAGLLYRYETDPPEGTVAICSFWETEFLALGGGTLAEAQEMFDRLIRFGNDLGLWRRN